MEETKKEMSQLEEGVWKVSVKNWPNGLVYYTDAELKKDGALYTPRMVETTIGKAFSPEDRPMEEVVHPIVAMSGILEEFGGFDNENLQKAVECINWHLANERYEFRAGSSPESVQNAVAAGYLRERVIEGKTVYFPTGKSIRAMCNQKFEDFMYSLSMMSGIGIGTGHRRV